MYIHVAREVKDEAIGLASMTANQYVSDVKASIICKQIARHQLARGRIGSSTLIAENDRHLSDHVWGLSNGTATEVMLGRDHQRRPISVIAIVIANDHHRRITEITVGVH